MLVFSSTSPDTSEPRCVSTSPELLMKPLTVACLPKSTEPALQRLNHRCNTNNPVALGCANLLGGGALGGPLQERSDYAQLFLMPGRNLCVGGPATDRFDSLSVIDSW